MDDALGFGIALVEDLLDGLIDRLEHVEHPAAIGPPGRRAVSAEVVGELAITPPRERGVRAEIILGERLLVGARGGQCQQRYGRSKSQRSTLWLKAV